MKIKRLLPIAFLFIYHPTSAQVFPEDSLRNLFLQSKSDQIKTEAALRLSEKYTAGNFDECLRYASAGSALAIKQGDTASLGAFDRVSGLAHYFKGNYDSAAHYYYRSLSRLQAATQQKQKALTLNELGKLYRKTRDLDRALIHYQEALGIYTGLGDEDNIATILNESGVVYEYKGQYEEAINRYRKSLAIREKTGDKLGRSYSLSFLGGVYTLQKNFTQAREYLEAALQERIALKDSFAIALSYADLGNMYKEMGQADDALIQFKLANTLAARMGFMQFMIENYRQMAGLEESRGNPTGSLAYLKEYDMLKDSVMNAEKMKQIEALHARYETEKKEQQLRIQAAELSKKNILISAILGLLGLLLFAGYSLFRKKQAQSRLALQEAVHREQSEAARSVLEAEHKERNRIAAELHDGIGQMMSAARMNLSALEENLNLDETPIKKSWDNVKQLVDTSCREIRQISHQMMPQHKGLAVSLREFTDRIDPAMIRTSLHTDGWKPGIDPVMESVLFRVLQEAVQNVLKHAQARTLDIALNRDKEGIEITIEDDGIGFNPAVEKPGAGIGLKNMASRIAYLQGTVEWDSAPGRGTVVAIHIPYHEKNRAQ